MKQAQVLGVGNNTIDGWIQKSINSTEIQHVAHGKYSKNTNQTAQAVIAVSAVFAVI